jgi:hypothetical protein
LEAEDWVVRPIEEGSPREALSFERLPNIPGSERPQCGRGIEDMAESTNVDWRFSNGGKGFKSRYEVNPAFCSRRALYKVFGLCLCRGHAAAVALDIMLGEFDPTSVE